MTENDHHDRDTELIRRLWAWYRDAFEEDYRDDCRRECCQLFRDVRARLGEGER